MPFKLKHSPYYMLDSTYTVPSNPNTMRDTGPTRNAEYRVRDEIDSILEKRSNVTAKSGDNRSQISKNAVSAKKIKNIIEEMDKMKETMVSRCHH